MANKKCINEVNLPCSGNYAEIPLRSAVSFHFTGRKMPRYLISGRVGERWSAHRANLFENNNREGINSLELAIN